MKKLFICSLLLIASMQIFGQSILKTNIRYAFYSNGGKSDILGFDKEMKQEYLLLPVDTTEKHHRYGYFLILNSNGTFKSYLAVECGDGCGYWATGIYKRVGENQIQFTIKERTFGACLKNAPETKSLNKNLGIFNVWQGKTYIHLSKAPIPNPIPDDTPESLKPENNPNNPQYVHQVVEVPASFPGREMGLKEFLAKNIVYPPYAIENGVEGTVVCRFIVELDGSLSDIRIIKSVGDDSLDAEAIRVIKHMPQWIPASNNGKRVRAYYNLPVRFKLTTGEVKPSF